MSGQSESDLEIIERAISLCLDKNIPFVAFSLPGECLINFYSNPSPHSFVTDSEFIIHHDNCSTERIFLELNAEATIMALSSAPVRAASESIPYTGSTSHEEYITGVSRLIEKLKPIDAKTVISRIMAVTVPDDDNDSWAKTALDIMTENQATFSYIYFTHATGSWIGATPETLIDVDLKTRHFKTMALAGTRKKTEPGLWDEKNIHEHNFVVDYIASTLRDCSVEPHIGQRQTIDAGKFEHILTPVEGCLSALSVEDIISRLHPTPAIVGYPCDMALKMINETERHQRRCYGGYIALKTPRRYLAHVNLRCFQFAGNKACFYGGGGITSQSDPETEWNETTMKIEATLRYLRQSCEVSR